MSEYEKVIDRLRGQLQNCVNFLERAKRHDRTGGYESAIESANNALYETLAYPHPVADASPAAGGADDQRGWLKRSFAQFLRQQKGYSDEQILAELKANFGAPAQPTAQRAMSGEPAGMSIGERLATFGAAMNRINAAGGPTLPVEVYSDEALAKIRASLDEWMASRNKPRPPPPEFDSSVRYSSTSPEGSDSGKVGVSKMESTSESGPSGQDEIETQRLNYFVGNADGRGLIRLELADGTHVGSMARGAASEKFAKIICRRWNSDESDIATLSGQDEITDTMALAFHHALTDGSIGESDLEEIKTGLRAAFANYLCGVSMANGRADFCNRLYEGRESALAGAYAQIATLRDQIEQLKGALKKADKSLAESCDVHIAMRDQIAGIEKDAARYRWLRDVNNRFDYTTDFSAERDIDMIQMRVPVIGEPIFTDDGHFDYANELDRAIDAALAPTSTGDKP